MKKGRKHTKAQVQRILTDIRALMQQNVPDSQIRYALGLELRQYQYFARRINLQNQKIWHDLVKDEVATELLRLRASLEDTYQTALALSKTPDLGTGDLLAVLRAKDTVRLDIVTLLCEGTELLSDMQQKQQPNYHKVGQNKIMMQPHP